ncbi:putative tRNA 2'-phosphotransferase 1 [Venustampulla echinocandica]|uniref:Putative tRNA 2'-phosphotransferase 1 n=1 Tax=Venustampulla echinocandica TaxID=2656787 RepID=A0A370TPQ7_9HELO|nr:putative tRNA 2'-phosphotransferase 1 [Venustampulla echinocandica]RDL37511.1 putative tRNA 2'-phosphotransferase 1 [Venustampulla echinocandica]
MAAAVMQPLQGLSLDGGIMPPSPVSGNTSRHGRSKHGGSVAKKGRGRGYSTVDDREALISKALVWVLKRTVKEDEEQEEDEQKLVADADGWVDCEDALKMPNLETLAVTFSELQSFIASPASKSRFVLKLKPESEEEEADESDYIIRMIPTPAVSQATPSTTALKLTPLTTTTEDLPDLLVYETSYANYPLILASGGIKRAGGQPHVQFTSIMVDEDGTEVRPSSDADVSIYINLRSVMEADNKITWQRTESGNVVTAGDVNGALEKKYWKKAVARRPDIGVLFEDGEIRKEVPVGLRGKGVKGKKGKAKGLVGRGLKEMKTRSEDESQSGSD